MILIESKTLGTAQASIEFTSIPQDGTDLYVLASARASATELAGGAILFLRPNGLSTNQLSRILSGNGSSAISYDDSSILGRSNPNNFTANTFGNTSFYIPNYAGATNKSVLMDGAPENNATFTRLEMTSGLWSSTAAITSLTFITLAGNLEAGTIISLYKITKGSDGIVTTS
jgi:hypothetical protein